MAPDEKNQDGTKVAKHLSLHQKWEDNMTATHVLNVTKSITPIALLKVMQAVEQMKHGDTMDIMSANEHQKTDILALLPHASCRVVYMRKMKSRYKLTIIKDAAEQR
ncbi:MAG: sulfurtransferase TusA family protein [Pseudomonadota bacterium]